jgi:hypothetical protein
MWRVYLIVLFDNRCHYHKTGLNTSASRVIRPARQGLRFGFKTTSMADNEGQEPSREARLSDLDLRPRAATQDTALLGKVGHGVAGSNSCCAALSAWLVTVARGQRIGEVFLVDRMEISKEISEFRTGSNWIFVRGENLSNSFPGSESA